MAVGERRVASFIRRTARTAPCFEKSLLSARSSKFLGKFRTYRLACLSPSRSAAGVFFSPNSRALSAAAAASRAYLGTNGSPGARGAGEGGASSPSARVAASRRVSSLSDFASFFSLAPRSRSGCRRLRPPTSSSSMSPPSFDRFDPPAASGFRAYSATISPAPSAAAAVVLPRIVSSAASASRRDLNSTRPCAPCSGCSRLNFALCTGCFSASSNSSASFFALKWLGTFLTKSTGFCLPRGSER
mmetsp:Transcript_8907/g.32636  ORF Transcript_8907/g.32636 Transcript_8907/m.32636 type:complete len:245 (+) Transcript_8907:1242-1976(+)